MLKAREAATVLVTAAVTMAIVVVLMWPMGIGAADPPASPKVLRPTMTSGSCQFTMEAAQPSTEPGAKPSVMLTVANTGKTSVEATVWVVVSATQPASPMSRVVVMPRIVWTHKCNISLAAGATQTLTVPIDAQWPEGQSIIISMTDKEPAVPAGQAAAPNPAR